MVPALPRSSPFLLPALLFLVLLARPAPAAAQDAAVLSPAAYWELVADTEAQVTALAGSPPAEQQATLAALAGAWAEVTALRLPDGTLIPLDHEPFLQLLQAPEPDLAAISARLELLQTARHHWPEPVYDPDSTRQMGARLAEILARPAFQWEEAEPTLLQRIWQRILRTLFELLPTGAGNLLFTYALAALGAMVLLVVLLFAARALFAGFTSEAQREAVHPETDLTAEDALTRAQTLSQGGDYRSAVRYLYLSTLLLLDERGLLRYDRSRTNREYLRSMADRPELAATLRSVVEVFDRTWYGYQPLDAETYAAYEAEVNALKQVGRQR